MTRQRAARIEEYTIAIGATLVFGVMMSAILIVVLGG